MTPVVEVESLVKRYDRRTVVAEVSFRIAAGEVFGIVGPNGAGKTTLVECIEGLRRPDGGRVSTLGEDPSHGRRAFLERIGIQLQESNLPPRIRAGEAVRLFGSLYESSSSAEALLARVGLADKVSSPVENLSGGQRQRLFIALALVNEPELLFLDELTTGLDPHARRSMWRLIRDIRDGGTTVLLTTHFMEEAERLCDRVAILDGGTIIALDSPAELIRSLGERRRLEITLEDSATPDLGGLRGLPGVRGVSSRSNRLEIDVEGGRTSTAVLQSLLQQGASIRDFRTEEPTLEDVFLSLTGKSSIDQSSTGESEPARRSS